MKSGSTLPRRMQERIKKDHESGMTINSIARKHNLVWGTGNMVVHGRLRGKRPRPESQQDEFDKLVQGADRPAAAPQVASNIETQVALLQQELSFAKDQLRMVLSRLESIGA